MMHSFVESRAYRWIFKAVIFWFGALPIITYILDRLSRSQSGLPVSAAELRGARVKRFWAQIRPNALVILFFLVLLSLSLCSALISAAIELSTGADPIKLLSAFLSNISSEFFGAALTFLLIEVVFNRMVNQTDVMRQRAYKRFEEADTKFQKAFKRYQRRKAEKIGRFEWAFVNIPPEDVDEFKELIELGDFIDAQHFWDEMKVENPNASMPKKIPVKMLIQIKLTEAEKPAFRLVFEGEQDFERISQLREIDIEALRAKQAAEAKEQEQKDSQTEKDDL